MESSSICADQEAKESILSMRQWGKWPRVSKNLYLTPFFCEQIKQFILDITLNDYFIRSCDRRTTSKNPGKVLASSLQVNICGRRLSNEASSLKDTSQHLWYQMTSRLQSTARLITGAELIHLLLRMHEDWGGHDSPRILIETKLQIRNLEISHHSHARFHTTSLSGDDT